MAGVEGGLRVAVLGASGYVGGELLRLLVGHPEVAEVRAMSRSRSGVSCAAAHPSLANLGSECPVFESSDARTAGGWADVVMLALPHGSSQELLHEIEAGDPKLVVDTAADFRLADPVIAEAVYGPHARRDLLASFSCGLADVEGSRLAGARRVAVPGCFATASMLALWPVAGALDADSDPVCFAVTGSSGSGNEPKATTHHPRRAHNFFAYALEGHRHEAELNQRLRVWRGEAAPSCRLLTHSSPLVRGIHLTLRARLGVRSADLAARAAEAYAGRPFVHVLDSPPEVSSVVGTNHAHVHVSVRHDSKEVLVLVAIDNLVKGAAGQAVQCMNLALGFEEEAGLGFPGLAPC